MYFGTKTDEFLSRTIQYTYDAVGQLIETEEYEEQYDSILSDWKRDKKKLKAVTTYQYDKNGNLSTILFPEGGREIREYDTIDQLWKIRLEDPRSGIQKETVFTYDKVGNCLTERDRKGILSYEYDLFNQMIRKEDREGGVQRFFYDRKGNLIRWIDADGYEQEGEQATGVRFVYDDQGRFTKRYDPSGYLQEWNQYGRNGELLRQENGEGFLAEYQYDIGGRVTAITTAKAKKAGRVSQRYTYHAQGAIRSVQDGEGAITQYQLDPWGRITTVQNPDGSQEQYTYNDTGMITTTTDGKGGTITYHYDSQNQWSCVSDQIGETEYYTYDREGRIASYQDRNGNQIFYRWGMLGNLLEKKATKPNGKTKEEERYLYRYNQEGELIKAMGGGVTYCYSYTPNGWLKEKWVNGKRALCYTYTKGGQIKTQTDLSGVITEYEYDKNQRLIGIKERGQQIVTYQYDLAGFLKEICFANGVQLIYQYDEEKQLTQLQMRGKEGEVFFSYLYAYDWNGNQILKQGKEGSLSSGKTEYTYDAMQRLKQVCYPDGTEEVFGYDLAGNRIYKREGNQEEQYTYDKRNRLEQYLKIDRKNPNTPKQKTTYTYDAQGNTLTEFVTRNRGKEEEVWEDFQRKRYDYTLFQMTKCVEQENFKTQTKEVQRNQYDAENFRYGVEENGEQTYFITDGWNVFAETDADWNWKKRLIRGYGITASEERREKNTYHYYHTNKHEDIEILTNKKGEICNQYQYDAFGGRRKAEEKIPNRYTYSGELYDNLTGEYYLRARNYNPKIARFTQEDRYRGDGLNLYVYCKNNAVMYFDPSGYNEKSPKPPRAVYAVDDTEEAIKDALEKAKRKMYVANANDGFAMLVGDENKDVRSLLEKHGLKGIWYKNKRPDFTPVVLFNVKIDNMTNSRKGDGGTYAQTKEKIAEQLIKANGDFDRLMKENVIKKEATLETQRILKEFLKEKIKPILDSNSKENTKIRKIRGAIRKLQTGKKYTIHEVDAKSSICQLVPTEINKRFDHAGGVSDSGGTRRETEKEENNKKEEKGKNCSVT